MTLKSPNVAHDYRIILAHAAAAHLADELGKYLNNFHVPKAELVKLLAHARQLNSILQTIEHDNFQHTNPAATTTS